MSSPPDPQAQAALMLCESFALLLVEQGIVRKQLVIEAIEGVIEIKREIAGTREPVVVSVASILLLRRILDSLAAATDRETPAVA